MELSELRGATGRVLGVDFGEARTGLALSDTSRLLASGLGNIRGGGLAHTVEDIAAAVAEHKVTAVVLGLPVNMNGTEGPRAARVRELCGLLEERLDCPVVLLDERLTTMAATRFLNETNTRGTKRRGVIDTLSAEIILQNALDRLRA